MSQKSQSTVVERSKAHLDEAESVILEGLRSAVGRQGRSASRGGTKRIEFLIRMAATHHVSVAMLKTITGFSEPKIRKIIQQGRKK